MKKRQVRNDLSLSIGWANIILYSIHSSGVRARLCRTQDMDIIGKNDIMRVLK